MTKTIQERKFVADTVWFDCQSGAWSIKYRATDTLTGAKIDKTLQFARNELGENTTPKTVFDKVMSYYEAGKIP